MFFELGKNKTKRYYEKSKRQPELRNLIESLLLELSIANER